MTPSRSEASPPRSAIVSSVSPALKYSCSGSWLKFSNGRTTSITRVAGASTASPVRDGDDGRDHVARLKARSRIDWKRCAGSFSRQCRTMRSIAGGMPPPPSDSAAGASFRVAAITPARLRPENGRRPEIISYSRQPNAKMSLRASASRPSSCSGAMYCSVPKISPRSVSGAEAVSCAAGSTMPWLAACSFARPKSRSFGPVPVSMTLLGLRSRCTIPRSCAAASATATWVATSRASSSGIGPRASRAARVSPSRCSMTRKCVPPCSPMSWSVQIEGCESAEIARASRSKRSRIAGSSACRPSNTLIATNRPSRVSFALYTSPIPPAPSGETISYGPRRVPGVSGIDVVSACTQR